MSDPPLVATPVYGLRTWTVTGPSGDERLAGPQQRRAEWPPNGGWLEAECTSSPDHRPPSPGCGCGLHAWHPSRRTARDVLAGRRDIPGIVEARGAVEVHAEGFRAERARPCAFLLQPGRNARMARRLADRYAAELIEVHGPDDVLEACRARGLGLDARTVADLLGPAAAESRSRARRERTRAALRLAAVAAVVALLVVAGLALATDPPGERTLNGRTGEIRIESR